MISPSLPCIENFVIYIYGELFILPLHLNYNGICIDMFVHIITVSIFLSLCMLYSLIFGYTSSWYLCYISHAHGLFHHSVIFTSVFLLICWWILYLWLMQYVCVLHKICSLGALHLGNLIMYISCIWFVMPFLLSYLTYIHNSGLKYTCLN